MFIYEECLFTFKLRQAAMHCTILVILYIFISRKKSHGHELTQKDKDFTRNIDSESAAIKYINQSVKIYLILGVAYRDLFMILIK